MNREQWEAKHRRVQGRVQGQEQKAMHLRARDVLVSMEDLRLIGHELRRGWDLADAYDSAVRRVVTR